MIEERRKKYEKERHEKYQGIVSMKDAGRYGDQYVTVQIDVPKNLSNEAKRKLKEFEAACRNGSRGAA